MQNRTLTVGLFLLGLLLLVVALGLTAEAGVSVDNGTRTITLTSGSFNMDTIWADGSVDNSKLMNYTDGRWLSNYSIVVDIDATLVISPNDGPTGCSWLRLNASSNASWTGCINVTESGGGGIGGRLFVNDTMITGWNYTGDCNMSYVNLTTIRPWIYVHGGYEHNLTEAYFLNSTLGYLGYNQSERYGIVFRDVNVTGHYYPLGWMHNCTVLENYIGIAFQGVPRMNVTDSWFNDSKEVGIVYTVGTDFGGGQYGTYYYSDFGHVGDNLNTSIPCQSPTRDGVDVMHISGTTDPDGSNGIRLYYADNVTFNDVIINDSTNAGLVITHCENLTINNTVVRFCTDAADEYNIYMHSPDNCTFTNSTAHTPDGTADGGNWHIESGYYNTFTSCYGYLSSAHEDFYIESGYHNTFTSCQANNSNVGFLLYTTNNNTVSSCGGFNHTLYNFKLHGSPHNTMANDNAWYALINLYIIDIYDTDISHNNSLSNWDVRYGTSYGVCIGSDGGADNICHNNTLNIFTITGTTTGDGIYLFDHVLYNRIENTTVSSCIHPNADGFGLADTANRNTFSNCNSTLNGDAGYLISEDAHHNTLNNCTAYNNPDDGIELHGDPHNNTITVSYFNNNAWGLYMWPNVASSCGDNTFNNCTFNDNSECGLDIGRAPINYFYDCSIYNNTVYGVEMQTDAVAYIFNCVVDNPTTTNYDWYIDNTTTVDIYSPYILGFDKNINYQFDTVQPYGVASHDAGTGLWELNTTQMTIYCQSENTSYVNLTTWTSSPEKVQWVVNASSGTQLHQKIGGLTANTRYDLKVGSTIQSTNYSQSGTMMTTHGATSFVFFNYTGSWSNLTFTVERHTVPTGNGAQPTEDGEEVTEDQDTDGDGYSDAAELAAGSNPYDASSTPLTVYLGVEIWVWVVIAVGIVIAAIVIITFVVVPLAFPTFWKRFKRKHF